MFYDFSQLPVHVFLASTSVNHLKDILNPPAHNVSRACVEY
jgi:hypothetical protein